MTIIYVLMIMGQPGISWSDAVKGGFLPSYRVTTGISVYSTDLDVDNKNSLNPGGTLSENLSYSPSIIIGSPYHYFSDSNWASSIEYSFTGFRLNQQLVKNQLTDLGTSVNGYYVFVTPTIIYSFTDLQLSSKNTYSLLAGLGAGLGYLDASGDIIFTETTQQPLDFDISGPAIAMTLFMDYRIANYVTRLSAGLTRYSEGSLEYNSFGFAMNFGFVFNL